jgi:WD40 repeat protein
MLMSKRKLATVRTFAVVLLIPVSALLLAQGLAQTPGKDKPRVDQQGDPLPASALARFGSARFRHDGAFFLSYLPDGKSLLSVGMNGIVRVWDAASGTQVREFGKRAEEPDKGPGFNPWMGMGSTGAALSRDGKTLALTGPGGKVQLWEVATGKAGGVINAVGVGGPIYLEFSQDGKNLFVKSQDSTVHLYDAGTGKEVRKFDSTNPGQQRIFFGGSGGVALSPDGRKLAVMAGEIQNGQVRSYFKVWEVSTGKELRHLNGPANNPFNGPLVFSPDGKALVWGDFNGAIRFWDIDKDQESKQFAGKQQNQFPTGLQFSPDGKILAAKSGRSVQLWDVAQGKHLRQLGEADSMNGPPFAFWGDPYGSSAPLAFSKDGKSLAALDGNALRQWDVGSGKEKTAASGHQGAVLAAFASVDEKLITTLGADNTVRRWESATGKELSKLSLPAGAALALSADGKTLASMEFSTAMIRIWDVALGKEVRKMQQPRGKFQPWGMSELALSPDGKFLAVRGFDSSLQLWDAANAKELPAAIKPADPNGRFFVDYGMPGQRATDLVFAPDGRTLAFTQPEAGGGMNPGPYGMASRSIRLWDPVKGKQIMQLEGAYKGMLSLAWSPDGKTLAVRETDKLTVLETATGKSRFQIKKLPSAQIRYTPTGMGPVPAVAFSPDGKTLAATGDMQTPRLWDVMTGKEVGQLKGHQGDIEMLAFAAGGNRLISGSSDTTALLWDVALMRKVTPKESPALTPKALEGLWANLLGDDAAKAAQAMQTLHAAPKQAIALFKDKLKPAAGVDAKRLAQLIADLSSDTYKVRQSATVELQKLGDVAEQALTRFLKDADPPLEARKRVEKLLAKLGSALPSGEPLRTWRALEVLERIGTKEARQLLSPLTKGAADAQLTREAQQILQRLDQLALAQR